MRGSASDGTMGRMKLVPVGLSVMAGLCAVPLILTASGVGASTSVDTAAGLKKAKWSSGITATYATGSVRMQSNGLPSHSRPKYYAVPDGGVRVPNASTAHVAKDPTRAQNYDFSIPTTPTYTSTTTDAPLGSIGLMISGSVLFNPYEGDGSTVAMSNNFFLTRGKTKVWFVDTCSGHPTPSPSGQYHYHGLPGCVAAETDTKTGPSHIIGVAFDGFPIYGKRDINGKVVKVSALDTCNGITSATPEFPDGIYHYVLPGTADKTSSIRCFHGKVDSSLIQQMPPMRGLPPGR